MSRHFPPFMVTQCSRGRSKTPASGLYSKPGEFSPPFPNCFCNTSLILHCHLKQFPTSSPTFGFPVRNFVHISSIPCMLLALPTSPSMIPSFQKFAIRGRLVPRLIKHYITKENGGPEVMHS